MSQLIPFLGISHPDSLDDYLRSNRSRVVVNALHAKSGGGVTYLRNILPLLADDQRLELHLFLHSDQLSLFDRIDERIVVHVFNFSPGLLRLMAWEQLVMPIMARIMSADMIFSPANFGPILVQRQIILLRNALAVARTETRFSKRLYWVVLGVITFVTLIRAHRAIAVSQYAADSLSLGFSKFFKHKISVIHHGISQIFQPDSAVQRERFILAVSDIYVQKNLHSLFQAITAVFAKYPDVKLLIAGQIIDEWYYQRVLSLAEELGIRNKIEFLGRLDTQRLLDLYRRCCLFVFPSTAETFGNPLVEAMACGAPIVCSSSSAMPEIVGDAALLCDPMDPSDISRAILALMDDSQLRENLGQKGLERAKTFSWTETAKMTADILAEIGTR